MVVVIAMVSFAAGTRVNRSSGKSVPMADVTISPQTSKSSSSPEVPMERPVESNGRTREGRRDSVQKSIEPQISVSLSNITETLRGILEHSEFEDLDEKTAKALTLLGVSPAEKDAMKAMLAKITSETYAQEKIMLVPVQFTDKEIQIDHMPMENYSKTIAPRIQEGIRSVLRTDLAEVLISSMPWAEIYPVNEGSSLSFRISRSKSASLTAYLRKGLTTLGTGLNNRFADDGTPIPADLAFTDERWQPLLKGLTLLPKDDE